MSKILFNIEEQKLNILDAIIAQKGISRAEAIRHAIDIFIESESNKKELSNNAFGMWKGKNIDALKYQQKMRDEWE